MGNLNILWFSWPVWVERLSLVLCLSIQITVYALTLLLCLLLKLDVVYLCGVGSAFCGWLLGTSILLGHVMAICVALSVGSVWFCLQPPALVALGPVCGVSALPLAGGGGWDGCTWGQGAGGGR